MNIVLIGYRGTGKSTVARLLAEKLGRKLCDLDALIVQAAGKPVPRIVEEEGWPGFRRREALVVEAVSGRETGAVIDCGGGAVLDENNVRHLRESGRTVWLTASFDVILKRIGRDPNRPPLKDGTGFEAEQRQVLAERQEKYRAAADMVCDTTSAPPAATADAIIERFRNEAWL